jgi:mono/diheme cytochrome c family protein
MSEMRTTVKAMATVAVLAFGALAVPVARGDGSQVSETRRFNGSTLFRTYCASCHGESGRGNGAVAIFLRKRPADLTQIAKLNKGTFPADRVYQQIDGRKGVKAHGESQMPVWGDAFSRTATDADEAAVKEKIEALVDHLASIQEKPSR